ncbi:MAG TPA: hypothetical protein VF622_15275 [Segetibacter sp.]|jgi:hypothetical protein
MGKLFTVFFFFAIANVAFAQDSAFVKTYYLGSDSVSTYTTCFLTCDSNIVFIQLHEDETTGIEAGQEYFTENGGYLVQLKHSGKRLVNFKHQSKDFTVDPNRIFTRNGLKDNMTKLKLYNAVAAKQVTNLAKEILQSYVDDKKLVIALHNNTDERFSILSYKKGNPEAPNASKVSINEDMDPDDFILTTDTSIYRRIKEKNINVVLQSKNAKDDGSLSIYTHRKKIPYINIEAQHGHVEEQKQMLNAIKDIIESYSEIVDLNYIGTKK